MAAIWNLRVGCRAICAIALAGRLLVAAPTFAAEAGATTSNPLIIVEGSNTNAVIVVSPDAGRYERQAAEDLERYIELMTGAALSITRTPDAVKGAFSSGRPLIILGKAAIAAKPELSRRLSTVLKKDPHVRADGIVLLREGNRVYLAGSNDESHYFAVADLLRMWGVRWFMPGAFGEYAPEETRLIIGDLSETYAPPFELRNFWVGWNGESAGYDDFLVRNFMNAKSAVPKANHVLGIYTKGLGKNKFAIPLSDPNTAEMIAHQVDELYAKGSDFSLAMEDGLHVSPYPKDNELMALSWDKYSLTPSVTDPMLEMLNHVARRLRERHPESRSKIGFLAYLNMFLPPARDIELEPSLYGTLAPIDIDPNHSMDDPQSPPKQEYKTILERWAALLHGRLIIYDYDQSALLWRDIPNPSHQAFQKDVRQYRATGVLGISTESRMALATTFTNFYLRGQLMWDPDANVDELLADFYGKFFGPAAGPMRDYWNAIFDAWRTTIVTEHEYFMAPAIYKPALIARLGGYLKAAESAVAPLRDPARDLTRNERLYLERMQFVRLGFETLTSYIDMVTAAATQLDYSRAVAAGEAGLAARDSLGRMNKAFTTTINEKGPGFWSGEVAQYRDLLALTNGEKGRLLVKLPLEWSFHRDPDGEGLEKGFLDAPIDLTFWRAHRADYDEDTLKDYPLDQWEVVRSDLYVQAQGIRTPDRESYKGDLWYRTDISVPADVIASNPHLRFPGLFNQCELYVNGKEAARRKLNVLWWFNDYRFEWDIPLSGILHAGQNAIALRCHNPHHMGGMFRRPFIYSPVAAH